MFRRIVGLLLLVAGLTGVALSIGGVIIGRRLVDNAGSSLDNSLTLTSQSLDTVEDTLVLAKETVGDVNEGLVTVEETALHVGGTISETQPLLDQVTQVASEDVPESLEALQEAMPDVAEAAAVIDDTLVTLNDFRIDESFLGLEIQYDLGINYAPAVPLDESVDQIGSSLEGLPERLRSLNANLNVANENLETVSQDIFAISRDLETINDRIAEVDPLLNEYIRIVTDANDGIRQGRTNVSTQLEQIKLALTIVMIWLGLTQLAPLYLGWELLTDQRSKQEETQTITKI